MGAHKFAEPTVTPARWAFTVPDIPTVYVDKQLGSGLYAVRGGGGLCLDIDGAWSVEPSPSNRDNLEWIARHRFPTFEAAAAVARQAMIEAQRPIGEDE